MAETPNSLWAKALEYVKERVNPDAFSTWLGPTKVNDLVNSTLIIEVPNQFFIDWINQYYLSFIEEGLRRTSPNIYRIAFKVSSTSDTEIIPVSNPSQPPNLPIETIHRRYTFDNFIVGESNRFAYAASRAVAENPGNSYNPLFIYGGVGLGKTHLIQAIGNFSKKIKSYLRVYYTSAETLFLELIQGIQKGNTLDFKNKYRSQDVLLIDDIHYLIGKERLQEEIFHTFNHLHSEGHQVVFTSDRAPKEIPTLEERLSSRLSQGLVVDLQPPDLETRIAILHKKAESESFELPQEVAYYIATKIKSNIRELEGCLIRLIAKTSIEGSKLTIKETERILGDLIPKREGLSSQDIIEKVSHFYKISTNTLKSKSRTKEVVIVRQTAMFILRRVLNCSLKEIGAYFGGKDHSTVIHAINKIEEKINQDPEFAQKIGKLIGEIKKM